jgi:hypothetical protein
MSNNSNPKIDPEQPMVYQIRIKGHLGLISSLPGGLWEMFVGVWLIAKGSVLLLSFPGLQDPASWQNHMCHKGIQRMANSA